MAWYVKFDGVIGSSSNKDHLGWCVAASVRLGSQNTHVTNPSGRGTNAGRLRLEDIQIGLINDAGFPKLAEAAVKGTVFSKVVIHGTAFFKAIEEVYLELEMKNVLIASYQVGVLDNNRATDDMSMSLSFERYKTVYHQFDNQGKRQGDVEYAWNLSDG